jgi:hypothetical protein
VSHLCYRKGFYQLLSWVSTKALGNIRYLTINTRSNRVAIISSVITRIIFNSVQCWTVTFQPTSNKDTRDLFMLCLILMCQLHRVLFYYCYSIILLLLDFYSILFIFLLSIQFFSFHCSLFMRKIFNSDPGLYSRYFDPIVCEVPVTITICASQ